jgi:hypothetical protein
MKQFLKLPCMLTEDAMAEMAKNPGFPESRVSRNHGPSLSKSRGR